MNYNDLYQSGGFKGASREWIVANTDLADFAAGLGGRPSLLDAGCGDGEWSVLLSEWYDVTGLDLSEVGIGIALNRNLEDGRVATFACRSAIDLSPDETYDVVFARAPSFLNHPSDSPVLRQNLERLLLHCRRRLYYIKYSKPPYERWVDSKFFEGFDTDPESAPDSRWYFNDPEKLQADLAQFCQATVRVHGSYLIAVLEASPPKVP